MTNSLQALGRSGIFCTEPFRIQFAGAVDVCCFDKTGTLTSDELTARGVALSSEFIDDKANLPADTFLVLASCHAVSRGANGLFGDSLERAQLAFAGVDRPDKVRVLKRYGFSSELRRMTCVCTQGASTVVTCKGAPEALRPLLRDVPGRLRRVVRAARVEGHEGARFSFSRNGTTRLEERATSTAEADLDVSRLPVLDLAAETRNQKRHPAPPSVRPQVRYYYRRQRPHGGARRPVGGHSGG